MTSPHRSATLRELDTEIRPYADRRTNMTWFIPLVGGDVLFEENGRPVYCTSYSEADQVLSKYRHAELPIVAGPYDQDELPDDAPDGPFVPGDNRQALICSACLVGGMLQPGMPCAACGGTMIAQPTAPDTDLSTRINCGVKYCPHTAVWMIETLYGHPRVFPFCVLCFANLKDSIIQLILIGEPRCPACHQPAHDAQHCPEIAAALHAPAQPPITVPCVYCSTGRVALEGRRQHECNGLISGFEDGRRVWTGVQIV